MKNGFPQEEDTHIRHQQSKRLGATEVVVLVLVRADGADGLSVVGRRCQESYHIRHTEVRWSGVHRLTLVQPGGIQVLHISNGVGPSHQTSHQTSSFGSSSSLVVFKDHYIGACNKES